MKLQLVWLASAAIAACGLSAPAHAQVVAGPGDLDAAFDGDGRVMTDFGGSDAAAGVAMQADGRIVVAGSSGGNFALARYTADGALDPAFSGDGLVTTDFGGSDAAADVAIQADGRIVVAGSTSENFALARYDADGSLDPSFSGDGMQTADFGAVDSGAAVAIDSGGRIVVAGRAGADFGVARFTSAGAPDGSFSGDGRQTTDFGGFDSGSGVTIQSDGRILVAGASDTSEDGVPASDFALARYGDDGAPDAAFDGDGRQTTDFGGTYDMGEDVALQSDGRIVVAGHGSAADSFESYYPSDFELARYDAAGALDTTFSEDGRQTTDFGGDEFAYAVAPAANGRIVAVGKAGPAFALARYDAAGSLDPAFSGDGRQTTDVTLLASNVVGVDGTLQADGKLVAAGTTAGLGGLTDFVLARYLGDPPEQSPPDTTVDSGPSGLTNGTAPAFAFTATLASTFECKLDTPAGAGSYAPCTSPQAYATTVDGPYEFSVRATREGSTDPSPASRSFTVDTAAPQTTITSGPSGPPFAFASDEAATFACRLDGPGAATGTYADCASPQAYSALADGSYTFSVRATDLAGNTDATPETRTFTLTTAPILELSFGGAANFAPFIPGTAREYDASAVATVTSTAGAATLTVADPATTATGRLVNGAFAFTRALQVRATNAANPSTTFAAVTGSADPLTLLTYAGPAAGDQVTIELRQAILAAEPLRTGAYSKTLTFTLSTSTP